MEEIKELVFLLAIGSLIIIPIGAYLDARIIKLHSAKQYLAICTWEYSIFVLGLVTGILFMWK